MTDDTHIPKHRGCRPTPTRSMRRMEPADLTRLVCVMLSRCREHQDEAHAAPTPDMQSWHLGYAAAWNDAADTLLHYANTHAGGTYG